MAKNKTSNAYPYYSRNKIDFDLDNFLCDYDVGIPEQRDFEGCCGAQIITGFPEFNSDWVLEIKREYAEQVSDWKRETDAEDRGKQGKMPTDAQFQEMVVKKIGPISVHPFSITFAILIESQLIFKPLLIEKGFRLVSDRNVNKSTGNRLYVFIRDPETPKGNKLKKSKFKR